jgi:toxin ParE1/3/4
VPAFRYSRRAEADLLGIGRYTLRTWGEEQATRYIDDLEACCRMLAGNPMLGRACDHIRPGLRRMERGEHVVFYREGDTGVLVSRMHRRVLPERQFDDDEEDGP